MQSLTNTARVFLPFAAGYFLSYLYRVVNAVIAPDLVADIGVTPSALGGLTAIYLIAFASSQLPLGILLDRFGPRRMEAALLLFAGLGAFLFARATTLSQLVLARALIGFGVSACLMAALKAFTLWFPRHRWPMINGLQMAAGGLGALAATAPVEALLPFLEWRGVFLLLSGLTVTTAMLVYLVVPERPVQGTTESLADQLGGMTHIFTSRIFWRIAPLTTLSQASFITIQGLWAGPWLRDVVDLDRATAAMVLFWVASAMIAGFIILGSLAGRLSRHGIAPQYTSVAGMALAMVAQAILLFGSQHLLLLQWMVFGFFGTSGIINYAALSQAFPVHLSGRVTTAVNLLVFLAAFSGQWAIGAIIELWPTGEGSYAPTGFRVGFALLLVLQVLTLCWFLLEGRRAQQAKA